MGCASSKTVVGRPSNPARAPPPESNPEYCPAYYFATNAKTAALNTTAIGETLRAAQDGGRLDGFGHASNQPATSDALPKTPNIALSNSMGPVTGQVIGNTQKLTSKIPSKRSGFDFIHISLPFDLF
jgi:hypothetical protein